MKKIKEYINNDELKINYQGKYLNVVNYQEIVLLESEKIILLKDNKSIVIKGENLTLEKLLDLEVLIKGEIKSIEL